MLRTVAGLLPVALLAALVAVQTFAVGQTLVIDARLAGLIAAVIALLLRAPRFAALSALTDAVLYLVAALAATTPSSRKPACAME